MNFHAGAMLMCLAVVAAASLDEINQPKELHMHKSGSRPLYQRETGKATRRGAQPDVTFQVSLRSDTSWGNGVVLKFDDVKLNIGGAYNNHSGIFTAPVTGTYQFWANVMVNENTNMAVEIKGQKLLGRGYCYNLHRVASITTAALLNKGDHVWITKVAGRAVTSVRGNSYSSYGGTLLKQH
ncbi:complement C1q-like protein 4 [Haliotis rufescens]|uniref:complement C1q-like protein 4 n=1 Tax=Haliotis rufescens TaxID=6454 RepID=UPI00201F6D8F|nr:complement C1q-like protein 4 [Haliotis rufescens]